MFLTQSLHSCVDDHTHYKMVILGTCYKIHYFSFRLYNDEEDNDDDDDDSDSETPRGKFLLNRSTLVQQLTKHLRRNPGILLRDSDSEDDDDHENEGEEDESANELKSGDEEEEEMGEEEEDVEGEEDSENDDDDTIDIFTDSGEVSVHLIVMKYITIMLGIRNSLFPN